jgi:hypothetical protein
MPTVTLPPLKPRSFRRLASDDAGQALRHYVMAIALATVLVVLVFTWYADAIYAAVLDFLTTVR